MSMSRILLQPYLRQRNANSAHVSVRGIMQHHWSNSHCPGSPVQSVFVLASALEKPGQQEKPQHMRVPVIMPNVNVQSNNVKSMSAQCIQYNHSVSVIVYYIILYPNSFSYMFCIDIINQTYTEYTAIGCNQMCPLRCSSCRPIQTGSLSQEQQGCMDGTEMQSMYSTSRLPSVPLGSPS